MNDILVQAEEGGTTILVLLNVSTAFDNTDHTTLINRLNTTKKKLWRGLCQICQIGVFSVSMRPHLLPGYIG